MAQKSFSNFSQGTAREMDARKQLLELFKNTPIPDDELLINLGLYTRSLILAKMLYLNELYSLILNIPGIVVEFGVWWGSNMALFEALRSVYEPYNLTRRIVGFDTWDGYQSFSQKDGESPHLQFVTDGGYRVTEQYTEYLSAVLNAHEQDNVLPHKKKYELVIGNVIKTLPDYLEAHPETIVALAYFDLALYEPTKKCLEVLRPHLVKGSVLALDELNSPDFPGETVALREVFGLDKYCLLRSKFLPDRSYIIIE